jgi:hypothetical protein
VATAGSDRNSGRIEVTTQQSKSESQVGIDKAQEPIDNGSGGGEMADGYDRFDNEGGGGGSFVMGLLTGTVLGAGLGMLFAPKAGSELRNQLSEQAGSLANTASEGYRRAQESAGQWAELGRDVYGLAAG